MPATIENLDLSPRRGLERRFVLELAQGEWVRNHLNVIILGPTGTGKTYLACALGHSACRHDLTVRYERTARFLHQLKLAHADGSYPDLLNKLARIQLLIFDDWLRDAIERANRTPEDSRRDYQDFLLSANREKEGLKAIFEDALVAELARMGFVREAELKEARGEVDELRRRVEGLEAMLDRLRDR